MKKILFAISMEGISANDAKNFEERTVNALMSGSKEYSQIQPYHVDYKDSVLRMCKQYSIDVLVISEKLHGNEDIQKIIKNVKSELPAILIVVLTTEQRKVGDLFLANMVTSGVYNWIPAPWRPESVANLIISPKKLNDVEIYMPKLVENSNGLAFDTVVVEKKDLYQPTEELGDILKFSGSNGSVVEDLEDLNKEENPTDVAYSKKIKTRKIKFGSFSKPKFIKPEEVKPENDFVALKPEEEKVTEEKVKEEKTEQIADEKGFMDFFNEYMSSVNKENEKEAETHEIPLPSFAEEIEDIKPSKPAPTPAFSKKEEKPAPNIKKNFASRFEKTEKHLPVDNNVITLNTINFTPRYKKILFVRALPLSSLVPAHICSLMKAKFVDFNKNASAGNFFEDTVKTSIKSHEIPDNEFVVGDVIAGNGVEKLIGFFDMTIVILPEDTYAIRNFVERYSWVKDCGVIIDKATTGVLSIRTISKMIPQRHFLDTIKIEECRKDVELAFEKGQLLMDNPAYYEAIKFLIRDLME